MRREMNEGRVSRGGGTVGEGGSVSPWFDVAGWGEGLGGGGAGAANAPSSGA